MFMAQRNDFKNKQDKSWYSMKPKYPQKNFRRSAEEISMPPANSNDQKHPAIPCSNKSGLNNSSGTHIQSVSLNGPKQHNVCRNSSEPAISSSLGHHEHLFKQEDSKTSQLMTSSSADRVSWSPFMLRPPVIFSSVRMPYNAPMQMLQFPPPNVMPVSNNFLPYFMAQRPELLPSQYWSPVPYPEASDSFPPYYLENEPYMSTQSDSSWGYEFQPVSSHDNSSTDCSQFSASLPLPSDAHHGSKAEFCSRSSAVKSSANRDELQQQELTASVNKPKCTIQAPSIHFTTNTVLEKSKPALNPRGIVSCNSGNFVPCLSGNRSGVYQTKTLFQDACINTEYACTMLNVGTNADSSEFAITVGTNTELPHVLLNAATNTDSVEARTVETNTELSFESVGILPNTQQCDTQANVGGARLKSSAVLSSYSLDKKLDSRNCTLNELSAYRRKEFPDCFSSNSLSRTEAHFKVTGSEPRGGLRGEGEFHMLPSSVGQVKEENSIADGCLSEIYYSDEDSSDEIEDNVVKNHFTIKVDDEVRAKAPKVSASVVQNQSDLFSYSSLARSKLNRAIGNGLATSPPPANEVPGKSSNFSGSLFPVPNCAGTLHPLNVVQKEPSRPGSADSRVSNSFKKLPYLPPTPPECSFAPFSEQFQSPAKGEDYMQMVLSRNLNLTRQVMTMLLNVNPMFVLDPVAHRFATLNELLLIEQYQKEAKTCQQSQSEMKNLKDDQRKQNREFQDQFDRPGYKLTREMEESLLPLNLFQGTSANPSNVPQHNSLPPRLVRKLEQQTKMKEQIIRSAQYEQLHEQQQEGQQKQSHERHLKFLNDITCADDIQIRGALESREKLMDNLNSAASVDFQQERKLATQRKVRLVAYKRDGEPEKQIQTEKKTSKAWNSGTSFIHGSHSPDIDTEKITELSKISLGKYGNTLIKVSERSELTVEAATAGASRSSDDETWQMVCRKKRSIRTLSKSLRKPDIMFQ